MAHQQPFAVAAVDSAALKESSPVRIHRSHMVRAAMLVGVVAVRWVAAIVVAEEQVPVDVAEVEEHVVAAAPDLDSAVNTAGVGSAMCWQAGRAAIWVSVLAERGRTFVVTGVAAAVSVAKRSFVCAAWVAAPVVMRCSLHSRSLCSLHLIRWTVALVADRLMVVGDVVGVRLGVAIVVTLSVGNLRCAAVVVVLLHRYMTIDSDMAVVPADMGRMVERRTAAVQKRACQMKDKIAGQRPGSHRYSTVEGVHF